MGRQFTREELIKFYELLIENESGITAHPEFRKCLDRDENLYANQIIQEANKGIAYRSVACDVAELSDEEFWKVLDNTPYADLVEDNAAADIVKMAQKFKLV